MRLCAAGGERILAGSGAVIRSAVTEHAIGLLMAAAESGNAVRYGSSGTLGGGATSGVRIENYLKSLALTAAPS